MEGSAAMPTMIGGARRRGAVSVAITLVATALLIWAPKAEAREPLPAACSVNATPKACIEAALTARFAENEISVDEYGDFFWGSSGPAVYASGTNDEFDGYENGAEVEEGRVFRARMLPLTAGGLGVAYGGAGIATAPAPPVSGSFFVAGGIAELASSAFDAAHQITGC